MAVDAGTGSVRAVLFDLEGRQVGCVSREWEHREDPRYPGSMDFDWTANWALTAACIRAVLSDSGISPQDLAAISTTCMREGIVLYDEHYRELWACANVDARSSAQTEALIREHPGLEQELYMQSGQSFALDALPRLLWVKNQLPQLYKKTAWIGMFNDWLSLKLTGILAVEPSNGCTTGLFDLKTRRWDPSIAERCGLRTDIFPPVRECAEMIGETCGPFLEAAGLCPGIPVVAGGGDAQLGCIGVGAVDPGQAAVFGGSFWQYEYNIPQAVTDPLCRVRVNCHAIPGLWQYEALAFKPGLVMRWYRDAFCQEEKKEALRLGISPYDLLNREAEKLPAGCGGMLCTFSDVMNFINWKHASPTFTNFDLDSEKFNRYTFYRSILENTALVTKGHLDLVRASTGLYPDEIIFAGGAAKSPLWCQILADTLMLKVKVPAVKEATALGAAILAGHGVGIYPDLSRCAKALTRIEREFIPDVKNHEIYSRMYADWRSVYEAQLKLSDAGLTRHMWAAPGV